MIGPTRRVVKAFPSMLRIGLAEMVAYRAELVIWFLTATLPIVMLLIWDRVAEHGAVGGYDREAFARYFSATLVVRQLTSAWVVWELNESIRTGQISPALLKPVHPLVLPAAETLAALPFRVVVLTPILFLIWLWRPQMGLHLAWQEVPLLLVSMPCAWLLNYLSQAVFGALAFFLDQSLGIYQVWFGVFAILSGYLVPVSLMPAKAVPVLSLLPFRAMLGTPVEIAAGTLAGLDAARAVGIQLAWVVVFVLLTRVLWRAGVRRYEAFGA